MEEICISLLVWQDTTMATIWCCHKSHREEQPPSSRPRLLWSLWREWHRLSEKTLIPQDTRGLLSAWWLGYEVLEIKLPTAEQMLSQCFANAEQTPSERQANAGQRFGSVQQMLMAGKPEMLGCPIKFTSCGWISWRHKDCLDLQVPEWCKSSWKRLTHRLSPLKCCTPSAEKWNLHLPHKYTPSPSGKVSKRQGKPRE